MIESNEHYYRAQWMTPAQWACAEALADLFGGFHHIEARRIKAAGAHGIEYSTPQSLSTYDFNAMTHAVLMAHERAIRFEVAPSGPRLLKLYLHKRAHDGEFMHTRHPTIDQAIETFSKSRAALKKGAAC